MQNVPLLPLGDITNGCQPISVDLDEKKEQMKARRRAAYRKKKEEAASKQLDENQPALTILGKNVLCFINMFQHWDYITYPLGFIIYGYYVFMKLNHLNLCPTF